MTPNDYTQNNYAATMAAYARTTTTLLARLDDCLNKAPASSTAVKPAFRQPDSKEGNDT